MREMREEAEPGQLQATPSEASSNQRQMRHKRRITGRQVGDIPRKGGW